jgi:diguanylate cyclase (GGDEF)-like protein/PAS domain S-box-containing protein/putative nucleotidyltransferase with HDIG domain
MILELLVNIIPFITAAYIVVGLNLFKQKLGRKVSSFSLLMFASAIYSFGYFLELNTVSLQTLLLVRNFEYFGAILVPCVGILFISDLTETNVNIRTKVGLYTFSMTLWLIYITNQFHNAFYKSIKIFVGKYSAPITIKGIGYYFLLAFVMVFLFLSSTMLLRAYKTAKKTSKKKSFFFMFVAFQIPWISVFLILAGMDKYIDSVPATILIMSSLFLINEIKNDMFDLNINIWKNTFFHIEDPAFLVDKFGEIACSNKNLDSLFETLNTSVDETIYILNHCEFENKPVFFEINNECRCFNVKKHYLDTNGKFTSYLLIDITGKKLAHEKIEKSEEEHRLLVTQMQQGLAVHEIILDETGEAVDYRFISVNESYERITGLQGRDIIGKTVLEILPNTEKYWIEAYGKVALTGEPCQFENYSVELNKYFSVSVYSTKRNIFAVIISDVTERKEIEKQLLMKQSMLKSIAEATNELLSNSDIFSAMLNSLITVAKVTEVDRVYLYKNNYEKDCSTFTISQKIEWRPNFLEPHIDNKSLKDMTFDELDEFFWTLSQRLPFVSFVRNLKPSKTKTLLEESNILSVIALPIFVENQFWGFIGFDECEYERAWTEDEIAILMSFTNSISGAISRNSFEEKIRYLSYNDQLTGLYNRRFYEEELGRLDSENHIPLTLVMADVNGLKLTNDAFGHKLGDVLLTRFASILKKECRSNDIIARIGGDEFVILLPETDAKNAEKVINRINSAVNNEKMDTVILSVSIGYAVKQYESDDLNDVFKKAEDEMYKNKLSESSSVRSKTIDLIMNTLYEKNNREMLHSKRVSEICEAIANKLNLDKNSVNQIKLAGLMHDIGKIGIEENILNKPKGLSGNEWNEIERHAEIGYRILSSVNEFSEIAEYVLEHHERWDGKGYPKFLKGDEISLQARIISLADSYDAMTSDRPYRSALTNEQAINEIIKCSGTQFDTDIAKVFIEKVLQKEWKIYEVE